MARKPRDYKAEYAKRIERAMAKGLSRQRARGHQVQEHIIRKERREEFEETGLYSHQIKTIFQWATKRQFQIHDADQDPLDVVEWAKSVGYEAFKEYRKVWDAARRTYLREVKNKVYASRGLGYLQMLADNAGVDELSWLYYH